MMNKPLTFLMGCLSALMISGPVRAETLSVKVRAVKLRIAPQFWAAGSADLKYGDEVAVEKEAGEWYRVKTGAGKEGFLHSSALSERRVVLSSTKAPSKEADPSQVVMAGKGFSREVEQQYAGHGRESSYAQVNAMERLKISDAELLNFMRQGKLGPGEL